MDVKERVKRFVKTFGWEINVTIDKISSFFVPSEGILKNIGVSIFRFFHTPNNLA